MPITPIPGVCNKTFALFCIDYHQFKISSLNFENQRCTRSYFKKTICISYFVVHSLSHVPLFAIPWNAAHQAPLSSTTSQTLLKFMFIDLVMLSNHLILCCPHLLPSIFPSIRVFSNELALCISGQRVGALASATTYMYTYKIQPSTYFWFIYMFCYIYIYIYIYY